MLLDVCAGAVGCMPVSCCVYDTRLSVFAVHYWRGRGRRRAPSPRAYFAHIAASSPPPPLTRGVGSARGRRSLGMSLTAPLQGRKDACQSPVRAPDFPPTKAQQCGLVLTRFEQGCPRYDAVGHPLRARVSAVGAHLSPIDAPSSAHMTRIFVRCFERKHSSGGQPNNVRPAPTTLAYIRR